MDPSGIDARLQRLRYTIHALAAVGLLALLLGFWWSWIRPLTTQQAILSQRMDQLAKTQASAAAIRAEHMSLREQLSEVQQREAALLARVPDEPADEEFLALASGLAKESGLKIQDYRPGKSITGPACSSLELQLIAEGSYVNICRFLDGIAKLPRHTTVSGLHIGARGDKETCLVEISLLLYFGAPTESAPLGKGAPHA